jgi:predicted nuclease of predicted toxin-antitoxin system
VKLLLDENLSARVLPEILDLYPFSSHVGILGLSKTPDSVIWEQARTGSFCIVSKDSDFQLELAVQKALKGQVLIQFRPMQAKR